MLLDVSANGSFRPLAASAQWAAGRRGGHTGQPPLQRHHIVQGSTVSTRPTPRWPDCWARSSTRRRDDGRRIVQHQRRAVGSPSPRRHHRSAVPIGLPTRRDQIESSGKVTHGGSGHRRRRQGPGANHRFGADGPAAAAKLEIGDVITRPVASSSAASTIHRRMRATVRRLARSPTAGVASGSSTAPCRPQRRRRMPSRPCGAELPRLLRARR